LIPGLNTVLANLGNGLIKFGNGDRASAPRVLKLLEPAGAALAFASTISDDSIVHAQSDCLDAIFKLLGSDAYRKDEEIALSTGEALARIASSYLSNEEFDEGGAEWPSDMNDTFLRELKIPSKVIPLWKG